MQAVEKGYTLNMWPHEFHRQAMCDTDGKNIPNNTYTLPELDEAQLRLLRGPNPLLNWDNKYSQDFVKIA